MKTTALLLVLGTATAVTFVELIDDKPKPAAPKTTTNVDSLKAIVKMYDSLHAESLRIDSLLQADYERKRDSINNHYDKP